MGGAAPHINVNALAAVAVGAFVFGERRSLHLPMTLGDALLICGGAALMPLAK